MEITPPGGRWTTVVGLQPLHDGVRDPHRVRFDHSRRRGYKLAFWGTQAVGVSLYADAVVKGVAAMLEQPTRERLPEVETPALLIYGERDGLIPNPYLHPGFPSKVFEAGARAMPHCTLIEVEDAGHLAQLERPHGGTARSWTSSRIRAEPHPVHAPGSAAARASLRGGGRPGVRARRPRRSRPRRRPPPRPTGRTPRGTSPAAPTPAPGGPRAR